jgi:hypothetical protein
MKIHEASADLARCHAALGVTCSAFLTAYNPRSIAAEHEVNERAQRSLRTALTAKGFRYLEGLGVDPTGEWPAEPSVFVPGISIESSEVVGRDFNQNGFVWAGADAIPRLVLLR